MYALVDCNNFYCAVERLFQPRLKGRPVVVLSNNDGCVISRNEEAKALGIVMGTPAHLIENIFKEKNVAVFSSNYTLYGDMSDRVMKTMSTFVPRMEIYSIDEAFLDMHDLPHVNLLELGMTIRQTVLRNTGIATTVGIAPTKTLAKMANRYAKKKYRDIGVFWAANQRLTHEMLAATEAGDIWGIGHQHALLLTRNGFRTAADLINAPNDWVRDKLSVVGLRLLNELRGTPSIKWEFTAPLKKNICTSRSFGKPASDIALIQEAVSNYAASCAEKLRRQKSCCREMIVFINTNPHKIEEPQYSRSVKIELERATSNTTELIRFALKGISIIYQHGYKFMKCGIIVQDLVSEDSVQASLLDNANLTRDKRVMAALDKINGTMGKETLKIATQGFKKNYRLRADHLSPRYTTNIKDIIKVKN